MNTTQTAAPSPAPTDEGSDEPSSRPGPEPDEPLQSSESADADDVPPEPAGVVLIDRAGRSLDLAWLRSTASAAAAQVGAVERVGVQVLDDDRMADLHGRHGGPAATTDVLTFPSSEPGAPLDADIAVCVDVAARAAAERGHAVERELLLYILHGLLHCAGYDDHAPADFDAMHAREDEILAAIGVGATFREGGA